MISYTFRLTEFFPIDLNQGLFYPSEDIWQCLETFLVSQLGVAIYWVEALDTDEHVTKYRTIPTTKNDLA